VYAPATNPVHDDAAPPQNAHDSIGDFAGGLLLATAWSSAVEHQLGVSLGTDTARRGAECLAGAWAADSASSLSPGDLDEAVTTLVSAGAGHARRGPPFDRGGAVPGGRRDRRPRSPPASGPPR